MLRKLTIQNYALVDHIEINFGPGLTVLTGETGAGKSIIIGGLLLALGGRSDRELIRHGRQKAEAEASFDLPAFAPLRQMIEDFRLPDSGDAIRIRREVWESGSSKGYVNGRPENLATIRSLGERLADFHSQQGQRHLLEVDKHLWFLDSYAGLSAAAETLAGFYDDYTAAAKRLADARTNAAALQDRLELITFQITELEQSHVHIGEDDELSQERKRLESVQALAEAGQAVVAAVSESDGAILTMLSQLERRLSEAATIDSRLADDLGLLSESVVNLKELTRSLQGYLSRLEDDPQRLEEINARQAELYRLRKKYNIDEAGLLTKLEELRRETMGAEDVAALIARLAEQSDKSRQTYLDLARSLSAARRKAAPTLERQVGAQLADLAIAEARFKIDFVTERDDDGFECDGTKVKACPHGLESVEFLISTNPNEPLRPLVKIASGGELSRIMLALLTVIAGKYRLPTIIFDEIDAGIGGRTAVKLARKLKDLSRRHQVLTISHLPAIAEVADHHLAVSKSPKAGRNIISVKEVSGAEAVKELHRMTGKP